MSGEPEVWTDHQDAVWVCWGGRGPVLRLTEDGTVTEQYHSPAGVWDVDTEAAADWAVETIRGTKMSKAARKELAERLGCDPVDLE